MAFLGTSKALEGLPVEAVPLTLEEDTAVVAIDLAGYTTTLVDSFFCAGYPNSAGDTTFLLPAHRDGTLREEQGLLMQPTVCNQSQTKAQISVNQKERNIAFPHPFPDRRAEGPIGSSPILFTLAKVG